MAVRSWPAIAIVVDSGFADFAIGIAAAAIFDSAQCCFDPVIATVALVVVAVAVDSVLMTGSADLSDPDFVRRSAVVIVGLVGAASF